ncbi:MAG: hypothetical protein ACTTK5_04200 [Candidatus Fimenecus sp.]
MLSVNNVEVWGFRHAIRGMRNPMNSWNRMDSTFDETGALITLGENDRSLMNRLFKAGTEHRKYLRQVSVSLDITAPLYWWKEFDTYKVGTAANSTSTMHKLTSKIIELSDFSFDSEDGEIADFAKEDFLKVVEICESLRLRYMATKEKHIWRALIQLLPESYNQTRTVTLNYENVFNIIHQRTGHKLSEWHTLVDEFKKLPCVKEISE